MLQASARVSHGLFPRVIEHRQVYLLLLPVLLNFVIFHYIPMAGILIAFKDYNIVRGFARSEWVGFGNFLRFFNSFYFWRLLRNTLAVSILMLVFGFPAPILLALIFNEMRRESFKRFAQTISYMPHFLSAVVVVGLVTTFLSPTGIVNQFLGKLGVEPIFFLGKPQYFRPIYLIMNMWQSMGFGAIIYFAAISALDSELYEAAVIEGAGRIRLMWSITLPGIRPTIIVLLILRLGRLMDVSWQKILLLRNPMIYETSDVIQVFVYERGLLNAEFGFATAVGLFNSIIGFVLVISVNKLAKTYSDAYLF